MSLSAPSVAASAPAVAAEKLFFKSQGKYFHPLEAGKQCTAAHPAPCTFVFDGVSEFISSNGEVYEPKALVEIADGVSYKLKAKKSKEHPGVLHPFWTLAAVPAEFKERFPAAPKEEASAELKAARAAADAHRVFSNKLSRGQLESTNENQAKLKLLAAKRAEAEAAYKATQPVKVSKKRQRELEAEEAREKALAAAKEARAAKKARYETLTKKAGKKVKWTLAEAKEWVALSAVFA